MLEIKVETTAKINEIELANYFAHQITAEEFIKFLNCLANEKNRNDFIEMLKSVRVGEFAEYDIKLLERAAEIARENDLKWRRLR